MKTLFVTFLLAGHFVCAHSLPDSIIVNAGKRSKIIFFGQTRGDLKNLERLDLNQLLRKLNMQYAVINEDSITADVMQQGNQYRMKLDMSSSPSMNGISAQPKSLTAWQRYKKNTYLNGYVGTSVGGFGGTYSYTSPSPTSSELFSSNPNIKSTDFRLLNTFRLENRSIVGIGLFHDAFLMENKKTALKLRYGIGAELLSIRFRHSFGYSFNYVSTVALTGAQLSEYYQNLQNYITNLRIEPRASEARGNSYYLQLMPKIFIKGKKGKSLFSVGIGGRFNLNSIYLTNISLNRNFTGNTLQSYPSSIVDARNFFVAPFYFLRAGFSLIGEIGYKNIAVFCHYNPIFTTIVTYTNDYTESNRANIGFFNMGLKFGR